MISKSPGTVGLNQDGGGGCRWRTWSSISKIEFPVERRLTGEQSVQDRSQSVDVAQGRHQPLAPGGLLGSHVGRRAEDGARFGQAAIVLDLLRQAEVAHMRFALLVKENVGRLEITVEDAALVGVVNSLGDRDHELRGVLRVGGVRRECPAQARTADQLHREITLAVVLSHLVDRHDVGMVEPGDRLGLVLEPPQLRLAGERARPDHLQRHEAIETDLAGLVDDAHGAAAQLPANLVVAEVANPGAWIHGTIITCRSVAGAAEFGGRQ